MEKNITFKERLAILETKMDIIITDISEINKKVNSLTVWKIQVMVVVSSIATIITLLAKYFFI